MPSERHIMPGETHGSLLNRNANRHLPLQAYEVAEYARPKAAIVRAIRKFFEE